MAIAKNKSRLQVTFNNDTIELMNKTIEALSTQTIGVVSKSIFIETAVINYCDAIVQEFEKRNKVKKVIKDAVKA